VERNVFVRIAETCVTAVESLMRRLFQCTRVAMRLILVTQLSQLIRNSLGLKIFTGKVDRFSARSDRIFPLTFQVERIRICGHE